MKDNKVFQTLVGAGVLYIGFQLWRDGWFSWVLSDDVEGYSSTQLIVPVMAAILSFVQLVGIFTIGIVSGILPQVNDMIEWGTAAMRSAGDWLKSAVPKVTRGQPVRTSDPESPDWNWKPIALIVFLWWAWDSGLIDRLIDRLRPDGDSVVVVEDVDALLFSTADDMTQGQVTVSTSSIVAEKIEAAGVERRRLGSRQDVSGAEPWVARAAEAAPDDRSSMVLVGDRTEVVREIPSSVAEMEQVIAGF